MVRPAPSFRPHPGPRSRSATRGLLLAAAVLSAGAGCDQNAAATYESHARLDRAADLIATANRGYADAPDVDPEAFRAERMAEARQELDALAGTDDPTVRAGAGRLLGLLRAADARTQVHTAKLALGGLLAESANLTHRRAALGSVRQMLEAHADVGDDVGTALNEAGDESAAAAAALTTRLEELNARREARLAEAAAAEARAAEAFAEAAEADAAGFGLTDPQAKQDRLQEAYAARRRGEAARLDAARATIAAERFAAEAVPLEAERTLWTRMSERVAELGTRETTDRDASRGVRDEAERIRDRVAASLDEAWAGLRQRFAEEVDAPLNAAVTAAREAAGHYETAAGAVAGPGRSGVGFSRFAAELELINALTLRAEAHRDLARLAETLGAPEQAATLRETADAAAAQANERIAAGTEYAGGLADDPALGASAAGLSEALRGYRTRLERG